MGMGILIRRKRPGEPWETAEEPSGGSQPQTQTHTFTTDADTFHGECVFDFGHATVATVVATLTAFTGDGETLGSAPGQIQLQLGGAGSFDGITFPAGIGSSPFPSSNNGDVEVALNTPVSGYEATPRYLKITGDWVDDSFIPYAGANHPFGTVSITITYL